jgi:hypothetical protein
VHASTARPNLFWRILYILQLCSHCFKALQIIFGIGRSINFDWVIEWFTYMMCFGDILCIVLLSSLACKKRAKLRSEIHGMFCMYVLLWKYVVCFGDMLCCEIRGVLATCTCLHVVCWATCLYVLCSDMLGYMFVRVMLSCRYVDYMFVSVIFWYSYVGLHVCACCVLLQTCWATCPRRTAQSTTRDWTVRRW